MKQINLISVAIALIATAFIFTACGDSDTFTDPRDGQKYKTVKIGDQVWMAENLKYKEGASSIKDTNIRYHWNTALVVCPDGWHLPSKSELDAVASDSTFNHIWSSTEIEDFTFYAYVKRDNEIFAASKDGWDGFGENVRCVKGSEEIKQKLTEFKGYKAVRIGSQIWMAKNLDIKTPNSVCYLDDEEECSNGRYYPFSEAKSVCPDGWHLPSKAEAVKLVNKLKKEHAVIEFGFTRGYFESTTEKYEKLWGEILWTNSNEYVIRRDNYELEIWNPVSKVKEGKIAVRCIADTEDKKEE